jgi:Protein of unknown function (DUF2652)
MTQGQALLLIADIRGYTSFVRSHRTSLVHAQDVVGRLLEAMIDAAPDLTLVEVEGDGVFFLGPPAGPAAGARVLVDRVGEMYRAFHAYQRRITTFNTCACHGCREAGDLRVKFVAHVGEIAPQRVKHSVKPGGLDVILLHRLLKNAVPIPEYLLVSEPLFALSDERVRSRGRELVLDLDGLGPVRTYFVDAAELASALPPDPIRTRGGTVREDLGVIVRSLPYLLRFRRPRFGLTS